MKPSKYFTVNDHDISPEIYTLLFSNILFDIRGNDGWYCLTEPDIGDEIEAGFMGGDVHETCVDLWNKQIARGSNNCYRDHERMKEFIADPCTYKEAMRSFCLWLKSKGVDFKSDAVFVGVSW